MTPRPDPQAPALGAPAATPERSREIRETLRALEAAWREAPNLRLCQLIVNATQRDDPFYVEDIALRDDLRAYPRVRA